MLNGRRAALPFILITVLIDMLGIGLIIPVLPAFVGEFTASRDLQAYWYGVLAASYGLMQFFTAPFLGALSDRFGRRPVLLLSILGLGLNFFITAMASSVWMLLASRLIGGAAGASMTVANAYIADITPEDQRAKNYGILGAVFGVGFIFGPMVGGLLGAIDLRLPFFAASAMSLLNWLYGFFVLPESLPKDRRTRVALSKANPFAALYGLAKLRGVGDLVLVFACMTLAQFILQTTWVLYTTFRFDWSSRDNGIALFIVGVMSALVQGVLMGRLLKRFGEVRLALLGVGSSAIAFILYGLAWQGWMMYVIIFANFLGFTAAPTLQGIISKAAEAGKQGWTMGSLNAISSIMIVIAPMIGAPLLAQVSHLPHTDWRVGLTFYIAAGLQLVGWWFTRRHFHRHHVPRAAPASTS